MPLIERLRDWLDRRIPASESATHEERPKKQEVVESSLSSPDEGTAPLSPLGQPLGRYRQQVEQFDEEHQALLGRLVQRVIVAVAYITPLVVAVFVGWEIGDSFGGGAIDSFNVAMHALALLTELLISGLALATVQALKRVLQDRSYLGRFLVALGLFGVLSAGSCVAVWWVITQREHLAPVVMISRVIMGPSADLAAIVVLAVLEYRSLRQHLQQLHLKAQAIRELAEAEIRLKEAEQAALNRQREAEQFLEARRRHEEALARMSEMQMEGAMRSLERVLRLIEDQGTNEFTRVRELPGSSSWPLHRRALQNGLGGGEGEQVRA